MFRVAQVFIQVVFAVLLVGVQSYALVSLQTTGTVGYYRDDKQNQHLPLFYSLSYSGVHSHHLETNLDLSLQNDLYESQWKAIPSQAQVVIPLSSGFFSAPYKKTRIQLGRQVLMQGFDLALLDGAQMPVYWSEYGGVWLYGGGTRTMDQYDWDTEPLAGLTVFQSVFGVHTRAGYSGRKNGLKQSQAHIELSREFNVALRPHWITKEEWDLSAQSFRQSHNELSLELTDWLAVSGGHFFREPQKLAVNEKRFLYKLLAESPQETSFGSTRVQLSDDLVFDGSVKRMRFKSGYTSYDAGYQQEAALTATVGRRKYLTPSVNHVEGYGGEMWDTGLTYQASLTDTTELRSEWSLAQYNKINGINGWAFQTRNGLNFLLSKNFMAMSWVELEKNHIFEFDARVFCHVTYYQ